MNSFTYLRQKNDVSSAYILIARDFQSHVLYGINDATSATITWRSDASDLPNYGLNFIVLLSDCFSFELFSRNPSTLYFANTSSNNCSIKKNSSEIKIAYSNRECSSQFENVSLTYFIGHTNL